MSWNIFKSQMIPYMQNPDGVNSKEDFAKTFCNAYDSTMKLGTLTVQGISGKLPISKGNKQLMEKLMISACSNALTKEEPGKHTFLQDVGKAIQAYWSTAQLVSIPPLPPAVGSFQNISLTSGLVSNPGKWPNTPPEQPTDSVDTFINSFVSYATIHLTTVEFVCNTVSLYPGFPTTPPLPGVLQTKGYTIPG
jgi:hypothetical protein